MKNIKALFFILILLPVLSLTVGCTSYNLQQSPDLQDLSNIPVPRSGGPNALLDFRSESFLSALRNSGYFKTVTTDSTAPKDLIIHTRYGQRTKTGNFLVSLNAVTSLFTVGIVPTGLPFYEYFTVKIQDNNGKTLLDKDYTFKSTKFVSIWPHVYLLGGHEKRVEKKQYAHLTSNIIKDLNELGLISK